MTTKEYKNRARIGGGRVGGRKITKSELGNIDYIQREQLNLLVEIG